MVVMLVFLLQQFGVQQARVEPWQHRVTQPLELQHMLCRAAGIVITAESIHESRLAWLLCSLHEAGPSIGQYNTASIGAHFKNAGQHYAALCTIT